MNYPPSQNSNSTVYAKFKPAEVENAESVRSVVLQTVEQLLMNSGDVHLSIDVRFKPTHNPAHSMATASIQLTKPNNYQPEAGDKVIPIPRKAVSEIKSAEKKSEGSLEGSKEKTKKEKNKKIVKQKKAVPMKAMRHGIPTGEYYAVNQWVVPEQSNTDRTAKELQAEIGIREAGEMDDSTSREASSLEHVDIDSLPGSGKEEMNTKNTQTEASTPGSPVRHRGTIELSEGPKKKTTANISVQ